MDGEVHSISQLVDLSFENTEIIFLVNKMDYLIPAMLYIYFATCMQHGNRQSVIVKQEKDR